MLKRVGIILIIIFISFGLIYELLRNLYHLDQDTSLVTKDFPPKEGSKLPQGFDYDKKLSIPQGFRLAVFANLKDVGSPRVLAFDPNGIIVVSIPSEGKVLALPDRDRNGMVDEFVVVIDKLNKPHGITFHGENFFVAETDKVVKFTFNTQDLKAEDPNILLNITAALKGGVDIIQLRSKTLTDPALIRLGMNIRKATRKFKKLFIVNDRVDLMLAMDADGVHLGQHDVSIFTARKIIGNRDKIVGRSTHSMAQAIQAEREGADYIGFGPIFQTPTKPTYRPIGLSQIHEVMKCVRIPVVCVGGIDRSNVRKVMEAGAERVAVVRAIFSAKNAYQAAHELKGLISK